MAHSIGMATSTRAAPALDFDRLVVILLKPGHYTDDGFPHRYWKAMVPSDSLGAMYTLTSEALRNILPDDFPVEIHVLEDGIARQATRLKQLLKRFPERGTKLIVGFVAVQTAQFPRAVDLIHRWQARGAICVIGGFHVSGSIATMFDGVVDRTRPDIPCPHVMPAEIQELMDEGVTVFHGEAEEAWKDALRDLILGTAKPLYRGGTPSLDDAPLPEFPLEYFEGNFASTMRTFDTGRGCPFVCSFCTIINVQGRKSRQRNPAAIVAEVRRFCERDGQARFFFTDDNFARNPKWEALLDGLIDLRQRGGDIAFMIEADLACDKIPGFIEKLAAAGCVQIFMGVESVNADNLIEAHKRQNRVNEYARLWERCHQFGILVHAGYIIGFSHDTPESVVRDVAYLHSLGVDIASFFNLTPLHGSEDHARQVAAGVAMDADLARYDSFHTVTDHPRMTRAEWMRAYRRAWRQFYSVSNMVTAMKRCKTRQARIGLLRNYLWYRWSFATEDAHPMIAGFYRFRDFWDRRPSAAPLSFGRYCVQEVVRHIRYFSRLLAEFYRFQHVVYETEFQPALSEQREGLSDRIHGIGDWARLTWGKRPTRRWLNNFWIAYGRNRWHLLWDPLAYRWHLMALPYAFSEVVYTVRFAFKLPRLVKTITT